MPIAALRAAVVDRVVFYGQSLIFPVGMTATETFPVRTMGGLAAPHAVAGFPALGWSDLASSGFLAGVLRAGPQCQGLVCLGGNSDLVDGTSGAATYALIAGQVMQAKAAGIDWAIGCTIPPSLPNDATDTERLAYNAAIVTDTSGVFDDVVDLAADPRLDDHDDLAYFDPDQTHWNAAGANAGAQLLRPTLVGLLV